MDIKSKIGQLMMLDVRHWGKDEQNNNIPFTKPNTKINEIFSTYNIGGFILFKENVQSNSQTIKLLRGLQSNLDSPLLFGIDQEGGTVNRLPQGTSFSGNMAIAATKDYNNAERASYIIGKELGYLGINVNFAPVVDVNCNSNNPIIGIRSYSDNPVEVTKFAKKSISGYRKANIQPCIKHFPGHGDTDLDTHLGSVVLNKSRADLEDMELYPFNNLCDKVDLIMTAHMSIPSLDNTKHISKATNQEQYIPTTLSHKIITGLLKQEKGFKGLVVSDAMDMKSITTHYEEKFAVKECILAGIDIVLMPVRIWSDNDIYKIVELFDYLETEYKNNPAFAARIDESYANIMDFKNTRKLDQSLIFTSSEEDHIALAEQNIYSNEHRSVELEIALKSTDIRKNNGLIPFKLQENNKVLVIDTDNDRLKDFTSELSRLNNTNLQVITRNIFTNTNDLNEDIKAADIVLLISSNLYKYSEHYTALTNIAASKTINIAAVNPYDAQHIDGIENYVCIYGSTSVDQTNYTKTQLKINITAALMNIFGL